MGFRMAGVHETNDCLETYIGVIASAHLACDYARAMLLRCGTYIKHC
jgi:hypothetical protein